MPVAKAKASKKHTVNIWKKDELTEHFHYEAAGVFLCVSSYSEEFMYALSKCVYFLAMHLNACNVERHFGWLHYESSVCYKSPLEHI